MAPTTIAVAIITCKKLLPHLLESMLIATTNNIKEAAKGISRNSRDKGDTSREVGSSRGSSVLGICCATEFM